MGVRAGMFSCSYLTEPNLAVLSTGMLNEGYGVSSKAISPQGVASGFDGDICSLNINDKS